MNLLKLLYKTSWTLFPGYSEKPIFDDVTITLALRSYNYAFC